MKYKSKINELRGLISELEEIMPSDFSEYKKLKEKAACERYFEKIVECMTDITLLIIKEKGLNIPDDDKSAYESLQDGGVISERLCKRLKDAKGMRNILAHEYGKVDDKLVFDSIRNEIIKDANKFIKEIE